MKQSPAKIAAAEVAIAIIAVAVMAAMVDAILSLAGNNQRYAFFGLRDDVIIPEICVVMLSRLRSINA